jgi:hypothetical protein
MNILSQVHSNYHPLLLLRGHYSLYLFTAEINICLTSSRTQAVHLYVFIILRSKIVNLDFGLHAIFIYFSRINIFS